MKNIIIIIIISIYSISCTKIENEQNLINETTPEHQSWNPTIILTRDGIKRSVIRSNKMLQSEKNNEIVLEKQIDADLYSKDEIHMSNLKSNKAVIFEKTDNLLAIGDVKVFSDSGITLYTDSLIWNNKKEKIFSNDSIMLTTNSNDTLYGIGFESNVDLTHWKIINPWGVSSEN